MLKINVKQLAAIILAVFLIKITIADPMRVRGGEKSPSEYRRTYLR